MVNLLRSRAVSDEPPASGCQPTMAKPGHLVAVHGAAPYRTAFRPTLRNYERAFDQALGYPPVMRQERKTDVDQRVCGCETLPGRGSTAVAVNYPLVLPEQVRMRPSGTLRQELCHRRLGTGSNPAGTTATLLTPPNVWLRSIFRRRYFRTLPLFSLRTF